MLTEHQHLVREAGAQRAISATAHGLKEKLAEMASGVSFDRERVREDTGHHEKSKASE